MRFEIEQNEILKLRKDILAFYNIEGDVSDEEYTQLKIFYQTDNPHANNVSHTSNHGETLLFTLNVILLIIGIIGAFILIVLGEFLSGFVIIGTLLLSFGFTSVFLTISKKLGYILGSPPSSLILDEPYLSYIYFQLSIETNKYLQSNTKI